MDKVTIALAGLFLVFAARADAQSISNRVTGVTSGAASVVGGATAGVTGLSGPQTSGVANPINDSSTGSTTGGVLGGAFGIKAGDKVIQFRGAATVGDDRGNFKAGVGIPF